MKDQCYDLSDEHCSQKQNLSGCYCCSEVGLLAPLHMPSTVCTCVCVCVCVCVRARMCMCPKLQRWLFFSILLCCHCSYDCDLVYLTIALMQRSSSLTSCSLVPHGRLLTSSDNSTRGTALSKCRCEKDSKILNVQGSVRWIGRLVQKYEAIYPSSPQKLSFSACSEQFAGS